MRKRRAKRARDHDEGVAAVYAPLPGPLRVGGLLSAACRTISTDVLHTALQSLSLRQRTQKPQTACCSQPCAADALHIGICLSCLLLVAACLSCWGSQCTWRRNPAVRLVPGLVPDEDSRSHMALDPWAGPCRCSPEVVNHDTQSVWPCSAHAVCAAAQTHLTPALARPPWATALPGSPGTLPCRGSLVVKPT